jgi:hypothetical protein
MNLAREVEAAKLLRAQLAEMGADDETLVDMIEGETSLREMVRDMVASVLLDEALAEGSKAHESKLRERRKTLESRAERKRALLVTALDVAGIPSLPCDVGTVSLKPTPPKAIITDESAIPSRYWKPVDPELDRKALADSLKARAQAIATATDIPDPEARKAALEAVARDYPAIAGAELSNGGKTVSIR